MSPINAYLTFDGNAAEAMRFYEKTLGGKLELLLKTSEGAPGAGCPGADPNSILHGCVEIQGRRLMASDWMGDQPYPGVGAFSLSLNYPSAAEAKRIFKLLADGGQVRMPIDKTFWAEAFGMLTDKFGTPWMVGGGQQAA